MSNFDIKDAAGATKTFKGTGAGTGVDPIIQTVGIDGTVTVTGPLTDTQLRATAVPVSGPLTDAQIRASALPVSGPLTDTQLRASAVPVSVAALPLPTGAATDANNNTIAGSAGTSPPALAASASGLLGWLRKIVDVLTGTLTVSGTVTANAGTGPFPVNDNGGSLTVDGAVSVSNLPATQAVSNAGTFATQENGAALTSLQLLDDVVSTIGSAAPTKGNLAAGTDGTNARAISVDGAGRQRVVSPPSWTANHQPAANTKATITKAAAGAGIKNVCTSIHVALMATTAPAATRVVFNLIDGASGGATILYTVALTITATAGAWVHFELPCWIEGSANTQMTLESSAAPGTSIFAEVAMTGTTTQ